MIKTLLIFTNASIKNFVMKFCSTIFDFFDDVFFALLILTRASIVVCTFIDIVFVLL